MAAFTHSVVVQNEAVTAGTVVSYDLPVGALSHLFLTLKFLQNLANTQVTFANIVAMLSKVEILYKGQAIISMNGLDLAALSAHIVGFVPWHINYMGDDNNVLSYTWLIPFGRRPFRGDECFPSTKRGEFILQITYGSSFTNIDGVYCQVEAVELPEAGPAQFLKATVLTGTPTATGQFDMELPIGNVISDLIIFGTTIPAAGVATVTVGDLQIRKNNKEILYSKANFETLHAMQGLFRSCPRDFGSHIHQIDGAAYAQYMDSSAVKAANHQFPNHLRVAFDPLGDGSYGLATADATSLCVRFTAGDTNAIRVLPVELIRVGA